jgi:type II secretory pathway pseudopilin PulG
MAIIATLASMLLPGLSRAKERARTVTCINNLRQVGIALKLYGDDHGDRFPPSRADDKNTRATLGGRDPIPRLEPQFPSARRRPLFTYLEPSEVYRCPRDQGQRILPCNNPPLKPSNWDTIGCSYQYNAGLLATFGGGGFKRTAEDPLDGLAGKYESWVPSPVHYILMHEPPARPYGCGGGSPEWYQWHFAQGSTDIQDPVAARPQFWSPILFVDGHTAVHNFTRALIMDPTHPYEPTKDWIWYKALDAPSTP